jgi:hypothetical protein
MLPVAFVEEVTALHMELSVGLMVVLQEAANPGKSTDASLWKCKYMFPDEAITGLGREEPEN